MVKITEKKTTTTNKEKMNNKKKEPESEIFASCSFSSLGLHPSLCDQLRDRMGFEAPTHVQAQAIPVILAGEHVLVNAATGTGKTVTYLAPIIHHLQDYTPRIDRSQGTFGISVLVATPGRLLDHLKNTSSFVHTNLRWIIFDEADRKSGSSSKGNEVSEFKRQNLLLSATLNEKVNHLAKMSLENPVLIGIDDKKMHPDALLERKGSDLNKEVEHPIKMTNSSSADYNLPAQLVQRYVKVPCGARLVVLLSILKHLFEREASQKIVLFFSTCDAVDFHYSLLSEFQWSPNSQSDAEHKQLFLRCKTLRLHGNMKQEDRRTTFGAFQTEKAALLLSTDVASRGLDFPKVKCIIQYDSPGDATEYVHRTARLGQRGDSLLFLQPIEVDYLQDLEKHGVSLAEYPLMKVMDSFPLYGQVPRGKKFVSVDLHPWVLTLQKALESFILAEPKMKNLAKDAFCSWVCAYTAHRGELKGIFMVKKLHLGHVAKSFALKEQPSLVGRSFQMQTKKRKREQKQKQKGPMRKRKVASKT
ncbi:hypothetical protein LWI29_008848 [Acer saccharum]|uniref:ATP-dependent RNA helicase n=1 Tax=Acer saccharum TaxID=4024 RepID=A0AA39SLI7_ACESA|nr:hypothetical protein LWI29_008848 [Acer saccharum]